MKSKELSVDFPDKIVARHRSELGHVTMSKVVNVPRGTVGWKKSGTTMTLPSLGCPAKLRNQTRRTLVREVTKNPSFRSPLHRQDILPERWPSQQYSMNHAFIEEWQERGHSKIYDSPLAVRQTAFKGLGLMREKLDSLGRTPNTMSGKQNTRHLVSAVQYHLYSEAWWQQHHAMRVF